MSEAGLSPFHRGEQAIQARVGVRDKVEEIGRRFIRDHMPDEHRAFYRQLPFVLVGSIDGEARPWASMLVGRPGFMESPDARTLRIRTTPLAGDPAAENLGEGSLIGLLGIQFQDRRRNRMNGHIASIEDDGITVRVGQSFGNCPMYIQTREHELIPRADPGGSGPAPMAIGRFDERLRELITRSDSFFIASHFAEGDGRATDGIDVSHRGGRPGFVRVDDDRTLTFPDFTGNTHFNTLGNILLNPRAGLLFIDFDNGDLAYLTGRAEIVWEGEELDAFTGAERLVRFRLDTGRLLPGALPIRWTFGDYSPVLEQTGSWEEVAATLAARREGNRYRDYTVERVVDESDLIRSFYLAPADGGRVPAHEPGQFLPLELHPPGTDGPVRRTYTISSAPNDQTLRLSIKRERAPSPDVPPGLASSFFHEHVGVGTTLRALNPRGCFTLNADCKRPVVLLSAGVGITPMIAMLEQLVRDRESCGPQRRIWFVHGARNGAEHAFADHLRALANECDALRTHVVYSAPRAEDVQGTDYDGAGRVDVDLLRSLLSFDDYEFYLCGPVPFLEDLHAGLTDLNIADERIHYEFFGPAAKLGRPGPVAMVAPPVDAPTQPVPVRFESSGIDTVWDPSEGTLLDLAEAEGLTPPYSCRSGVCQTCSTRVASGSVSYSDPPMSPPANGEALICCAYPGADGHGAPLVLDL